MVTEGIKRNRESTKAQAQPRWRSAERPRCFLDLPTMVPAAASRTQPFKWLALSFTFINLFDCLFYQLYLLVATPPKDTKHYWQYHNSGYAQKNHIKETLLQPTLLEDTTYIWQYIGRFFSSNIIPYTHFHRHAIVPSTYHDKSMRKFNSHTFRFPQFCALSP